MPSPRADAAPVTHRRQRLERTVGPQGRIPEVELFTPRSTVLPPGVVDTRPAGIRMIDVREAVREAEDQPFPVAPAPLGTLPPFDGTLFEVRPPQVRRVDIRDGVDLRDGVLDTRPPGLRIVDVPVLPAVPAPGPDQLAPVEPARRVSPHPRRCDLRRQEAARGRRTVGSLSVPQVGIASALGLATIAAPLTGALSMPSPSQSPIAIALPAAGADLDANLAFPMLSAAPSNAVEDLRVVSDESVTASVPASLLAPNRILVTSPRASRGSERPVLPGCTGVLPAGIDKAVNGRLPEAALCTLWDRNFALRADAAVSFAKLNVAYNQAFGRSICLTDAYRTLAAQYAIKAVRGGFAAAPGTSEHGWGLAVDLCGGASVASTATYTWLRANAPRYGWDNPDWARSSGSGPYEPWHWEFLVGEHQTSAGD